ncbi:uncharacterized protein LOC17890377 isoform X2 [Capsella rubella]|uniref:uncharacterized protein LOC17890377 isoform X2 n=1 Tax=Capsella rubella TaxID=81985 RepID=UPI000CD575B5|nr:uncharacterized protein LOC17890377 isoform X2 [Capsella rubella]
MTTKFDSGECIASEKSSISRDGIAEDSLKIDSLPPVENDDSVKEMISAKKQVKVSPFTSASEKDGEIVHSDPVEVSSSETSLEETEAMDVECPGVVSVPETGSTFLEENKVGEELQHIKEVSEISTVGDQFGNDVPKIGDVVETNGCVVSISDMKESLNSDKKGQDSDVHIKEVSEISTVGDQFGDDLLNIGDVVGTDGCVVSTSDKKESLNSDKNGQDSDAQMLLEAEKRRLLAEIEGGTIFKKKDDLDTLARASDVHKIEKNGKGSKDQHEKVERVRVKDNAFVGRSVNIDLVDDTALFDVVPFYKKGKDHPKRPGTDKDAPRKYKKVAGEKPIEKGNASSNVERNASTKVSDFRNRGGMNGEKLRIMYSRNQMESMRYAHIANQKKLWSDMYARLLPELVAEYEGLVCLKNHKNSKSNPRESGISILGPVSAVPRRTRVNIFVH